MNPIKSIAIIGLGYVGLPLAIEFGKNGNLIFGHVWGDEEDRDKDTVTLLKKKQSALGELIKDTSKNFDKKKEQYFKIMTQTPSLSTTQFLRVNQVTIAVK